METESESGNNKWKIPDKGCRTIEVEYRLDITAQYFFAIYFG